MFSRMVICACAGVLLAGCGSAPYRSGKGNDHLIMYRSDAEQPKVVEHDPVYVREPVEQRYVYYEPVPAYRVVTSRPAYSAVTSRPDYRYVPVTRYYYYAE
ncbi:MAG TPA: hypothetical protein VFG64_13865 [Dongiaceae bacterium]|nr:hypothetical protein [Dongiaceae bacterium]